METSARIKSGKLATGPSAGSVVDAFCRAFGVSQLLVVGKIELDLWMRPVGWPRNTALRRVVIPTW